MLPHIYISIDELLILYIINGRVFILTLITFVENLNGKI